MYKWQLGNQVGMVKTLIYGQSAAKYLCTYSLVNDGNFNFLSAQIKVQRLNDCWLSL